MSDVFMYVEFVKYIFILDDDHLPAKDLSFLQSLERAIYQAVWIMYGE